jgi:hypothetical protein
MPCHTFGDYQKFAFDGTHEIRDVSKIMTTSLFWQRHQQLSTTVSGICRCGGAHELNPSTEFITQYGQERATQHADRTLSKRGKQTNQALVGGGGGAGAEIEYTWKKRRKRDEELRKTRAVPLN